MVASTNSSRLASRCARHRSRLASPPSLDPLTARPMGETLPEVTVTSGNSNWVGGAMARSLKVADREKTAERLLNSSADKFYDPEVDIDWAAPLAEDKYFIPAHRSSLYGTALWDGLTERQRIELTKHEVASVASVGLWFEVLLMQMLVKAV